MPIMVDDKKKQFEKPPNGTYVGVIADVVDLGMVATSFGLKPKVRVVWLLNAKDSEGNNFQVMSQVNASANEKSQLYGIVKSVLGHVPPPPFDVEAMIGKSNQLFVVQEPNQAGTDVFANVKVILPLPVGAAPMAIPAGFVRRKDQPKQGQQTGTSNRPAQALQAVQTPATGQTTDEPTKDIEF